MLAKHAAALHAKVNLIPYNTVEGLDWRRPTDGDRPFRRDSSCRQSHRHRPPRKRPDIDAACGQLR